MFGFEITNCTEFNIKREFFAGTWKCVCGIAMVAGIIVIIVSLVTYLSPQSQNNAPSK